MKKRVILIVALSILVFLFGAASIGSQLRVDVVTSKAPAKESIVPEEDANETEETAATVAAPINDADEDEVNNADETVDNDETTPEEDKQDEGQPEEGDGEVSDQPTEQDPAEGATDPAEPTEPEGEESGGQPESTPGQTEPTDPEATEPAPEGPAEEKEVTTFPQFMLKAFGLGNMSKGWRIALKIIFIIGFAVSSFFLALVLARKPQKAQVVRSSVPVNNITNKPANKPTAQTPEKPVSKGPRIKF